jgi:Ca2+-binding EF-hand superfamily protein
MKKGFTIEGVTVDFTKSNRVRVNDTNYLLDEDALGGMGLEDLKKMVRSMPLPEMEI